MKLKLIQSLLLIVGLAVSANDTHAHEPANAGPTGGRRIAKVEPHAEFFVNSERKVEIRFLNEKNNVIAPGEQVVTVVMGDRAAPTHLAFAKSGDKLVSDKAIPDGNMIPTVVQIRNDPGAKAITQKFTLNLSKCPSCSNAEYACVCGH